MLSGKTALTQSQNLCQWHQHWLCPTVTRHPIGKGVALWTSRGVHANRNKAKGGQLTNWPDEHDLPVHKASWSWGTSLSLSLSLALSLSLSRPLPKFRYTSWLEFSVQPFILSRKTTRNVPTLPRESSDDSLLMDVFWRPIFADSGGSPAHHGGSACHAAPCSQACSGRPHALALAYLQRTLHKGPWGTGTTSFSHFGHTAKEDWFENFAHEMSASFYTYLGWLYLFASIHDCLYHCVAVCLPLFCVAGRAGRFTSSVPAKLPPQEPINQGGARHSNFCHFEQSLRRSNTSNHSKPLNQHWAS